MKGVETESYKNYINKLGELMIKNKKTELNKLNEIGNKVIDLDKAKKQLSKLKNMLAEAEEDDAKNEKKATEAEEDDAKNEKKATEAEPGKKITDKKKKVVKGVEDAMKVNKGDENKVGKIDLASVQEFLKNDKEIEVDTIKKAFEKTKQGNDKDYYDLFSKITKEDFIKEDTKYEKELLTNVAFGKNVVILESESKNKDVFNDVIAIRTDGDEPQIVSVMVKEDNTLKFANLNPKIPIGEGGTIPEEAENQMNTDKRKEVLINLNKFKELFPKYIGDATE